MFLSLCVTDDPLQLVQKPGKRDVSKQKQRSSAILMGTTTMSQTLASAGLGDGAGKTCREETFLHLANLA